MDNSACHECRSIAEEIAAAYADLWVSSDRRFKDAWIATYKMIGGTEEDFTRAEEILGPFRAASLPQLNFASDETMYGTVSARIREAIMRKCEHQALTGHKIRLALFPSSLSA